MSIEAAGDRRLWEPANEFSRLYAAGDEGGAVDVAVEALREGIVFEPPFESIWWLADQLRRRRHFALALALVESAFERGFRGWRIFYLRALFHGLLRHFPKAFNLLDSAIRTAPADSSREMKLLKGRFLAATGEPQEALRCFEANLKFGEDSVRLADIGIGIAWQAGNAELARRWTALADKKYGVSVDRTRGLSRRCFNGGLWDHSRAAAQAGLKLAPGDRFLQHMVCRCLYHEGKATAAITALEKQLKAEAEWTEGWVLLARALSVNGRKQEALYALAAARENGDDASIDSVGTELGFSEADYIREFDGAGNMERGNKHLSSIGDAELLHRLNNIPAEFLPAWTPDTVKATGNTLAATRTLFHSVWTIMLREMMARFGRRDLGYLWAVIEPLIHVLVLSSIFFGFRMRDSLGMNPFLFVATGIIPLFFYVKTEAVLTNALKQNRHLLNHASIQPMDIYLGRAALEFFTQLLVLTLFVIFIYIVIEPYRFGSVFWVVANLFGLWIFGIGVGLTVASLITYAEWLPSVMSGLNRLIYITSGVFFTLDQMPTSLAQYAAYNPLLHFVDGVRGNFNPLMGGSRVDIAYGYCWALGVLAVGLVADRALRRRVLDR